MAAAGAAMSTTSLGSAPPTGRVVLVTGAARGIGRAIAARLHAVAAGRAVSMRGW